MLQLRPNSASYDHDLLADSSEAWTCSFECTFCAPHGSEEAAPLT